MSDLQRITIKDTRDNLAHYIDRVAVAHRQYLITKFGKPKAMIVPVKDAQIDIKTKAISLRSHPARGMWKNREDMKDPAKWVAQMRRKQSLRVRG
jgi:prevent-host-death family protein